MSPSTVENKTITVKGIPEDLWRNIRVEAVRNGLKMGEYITHILREHFRTLRKSA